VGGFVPAMPGDERFSNPVSLKGVFPANTDWKAVTTPKAPPKFILADTFGR